MEAEEDNNFTMYSDEYNYITYATVCYQDDVQSLSSDSDNQELVGSSTFNNSIVLSKNPPLISSNSQVFVPEQSDYEEIDCNLSVVGLTLESKNNCNMELEASINNFKEMLKPKLKIKKKTSTKQYEEDFKQKAVKLAEKIGIAKAAKRLGIKNAKNIKRWKEKGIKRKRGSGRTIQITKIN